MSATDLHLLTNIIKDDLNPNNLHLVTENFKHTVIISQPTPVSGFRGGGSGLKVPQAIVVARALIKIKHVNPVLSKIRVLTRNILVKSTISVKIKNIVISLGMSVSGIEIKSFIQGLSLKISNEGIDIDDS